MEMSQTVMSALRVLAFLALIGFSNSQTSDCSYLGLLKHLNLTPADDALAVMRPVKNWTSATHVKIDLLLFGILQVDEKFQTVKSHIWIQMRWTNEFLIWNRSKFCGIKLLTIPRSRLWTPDVTIDEDASDSGSIKTNPLLSLHHTGLMFTSIQQQLTSTCQLNLYLFPFDTQRCNITFASMTSDLDSMVLDPGSNDTTLTRIAEQFMVTQGEWLLTNIKIIDCTFNRSGSSQSRLAYRVTITRKPLLYVINLIVPLFYLLVLDLASFFIGEARGEKLSFKVTILLSISVLLLILQDMLPSTEDSLPMIANYCVAIFALVGISVLEAMLVSYLIDLDGYCGKNAPSSADAQVDIQLEANCHKEPAAAEEKGQVNPQKSYHPLVGPDGHNLLKRILEEVKAARQEVRDKRKPGFCRRMAEIIDAVFFVLYFLTVLIFLTLMYAKWIRKWM